jgi:hypothetical protein
VRDLSTIPSSIKVDDIPDADVDHAQEALILLFELLLVKDLDGKNAVFSCFPGRSSLFAR